MEVIGLDIGHSAVKLAAGGQHIIFPTAATPAVDLALADAAAAAKGDTVRINGRDFFVGQTALIHTNGNLLDGLRDDWIETDEHLALLASGYQRGLGVTGDGDSMLVLGLPSRLHGRQHKRLAELAALHLKIDKERVRVVPQPLGAYMAAVLDESGEPVSGRDVASERWGIIDVGYYTADFGLIDNGIWSAAGARSAGGANVIATDLRDRIYAEHGLNLSLRDCDDILRTKVTRAYGKPLQLADLVESCCIAYSRGIAETAIQVFGDRLATLDGILIAGGAADLIYPHLRKDWPHAVTAAVPRFTVAEGMRRWGLLKSQAVTAAG